MNRTPTQIGGGLIVAVVFVVLAVVLWPSSDASEGDQQAAQVTVTVTPTVSSTRAVQATATPVRPSSQVGSPVGSTPRTGVGIPIDGTQSQWLVSITGFDNDMLLREDTLLYGFGDHGGYPQETPIDAFSLRTDLTLGDGFIAGKDYGFFSRVKVASVYEYLDRSGINVSWFDGDYARYLSLLHLEQDGVFAEVNLGFLDARKSREFQPVIAASPVQHLTMDQGVALPFQFPQTEQWPYNRHIAMYLVSKDHVNGEDGDSFPPLGDKQGVMRAFEVYSSFLGQLTKALYALEGKTPPPTPIRLRPTIYV